MTPDELALRIAEAVWPWASCAFGDDGQAVPWPSPDHPLRSAALEVGRVAVKAMDADQNVNMLTFQTLADCTDDEREELEWYLKFEYRVGPRMTRYLRQRGKQR